MCKFLFIVAMVALTALNPTAGISSSSSKQISADGPVPEDRIWIERTAPEQKNGYGYTLAYQVNVPMAVYWKFKTDFDNSFLLENKYIRKHRFVQQSGNIVITENKYTYGPDAFFRWRTTISLQRHRLDFTLLNPKACKQAYHYGYIQLDPEGQRTRVTQVAYFDFIGAAFWVYYPWKGGMRDFLLYSAKWEQTTAVRLKDQYDQNNDRQK